MRQPVIRPTCGFRWGEGSFASWISCYADLKITDGKIIRPVPGKKAWRMCRNWKRGGGEGVTKLGKWEKLFQRNEV